MVDKLCHVLTLSVFSFFSALQLTQSWVFYEINIANTNKQYPSISSIFVSLVTRRAVVLESKKSLMNFSNNVRSSRILVGSGGETDATTPNNVQTRKHQGKDTTHKTL